MNEMIFVSDLLQHPADCLRDLDVVVDDQHFQRPGRHRLSVSIGSAGVSVATFGSRQR